MIDIETIATNGELLGGKYKLVRPLNTEGGTADVWLALDADTVKDKKKLEKAIYLDDKTLDDMGLLVAIKIYRPKNALDVEGREKLLAEYLIVFECNHENLIHPTNFAFHGDIPFLVLPYCRNGSSELLIGSMTKAADIWKYVASVAAGLAYLHAKNPPIVHQDIKPANVLIDEDQNYAITDFGISAQQGSAHGVDFYSDDSGTMAYMAPERFLADAEPAPSSDIWAFGATLYELITGEVPFGAEGGKAQEEQQLKCPRMKGVSGSIKRLVNDCLQMNPERRPTAQQIVEAAKHRSYPLRPYLVWLWVLPLAIACLLAIWYFTQNEQEMITPPTPTTEELYGKALRQMDSSDTVTARKGFAMMDSLSDNNYLPAVYQVAYTYGWYDEDRAKHRKRMIGISYNENGIPTNDADKDKAQERFRKIIELADSAYPREVADAYYRIALSYYSRYPKEQRIDTATNTYKYLKGSLPWAELSGDSAMIMKVKKVLNQYHK